MKDENTRRTYHETTRPIDKNAAALCLRVFLFAVLLALLVLGSVEQAICVKRGGVLVVSPFMPPLVCVAPLREIEP